VKSVGKPSEAASFEVLNVVMGPGRGTGCSSQDVVRGSVGGETPRPPAPAPVRDRDTLLRCSLDQVLQDPRVLLHPPLLHKQVDRLWVLFQCYIAGWVTLACLRSHGGGCFIHEFSSVHTNLSKRGASRLGALVKQSDHVQEQLPHWVPVELQREVLPLQAFE
jgi:hypothetical protein